MNSKAKGSAGERELCAVLTARGFPAHRNDQRYIGGAGNPDISAQGLEGYHFEVKRVERLNVSEAMKQAARDASGRVPIVAHRRSREPWLVTMRLEDWLEGSAFRRSPDEPMTARGEPHPSEMLNFAQVSDKC